MLEFKKSCWSNLYGGPDSTPPVGGYSQLLILPRPGKSLPPPSNRPAIKPTHSARASPPIIVLHARRKPIILRIAPDHACPRGLGRRIFGGRILPASHASGAWRVLPSFLPTVNLPAGQLIPTSSTQTRRARFPIVSLWSVHRVSPWARLAQGSVAIGPTPPAFHVHFGWLAGRREMKLA